MTLNNLTKSITEERENIVLQKKTQNRSKKMVLAARGGALGAWKLLSKSS